MFYNETSLQAVINVNIQHKVDGTAQTRCNFNVCKQRSYVSFRYNHQIKGLVQNYG